ncbi:hypothetical protein EYF80_017465 [Liparis tanakae]|uniref:Uncharacterized protein n=1 Tax=Liparis tanakae TaxID=230148 RepID=A0A4Z2I508_9TELE|nr:hypothetical protein EYF80_017465 [Liparis tanakae]
MQGYLLRSRIIRLWKSEDMRRLKDGRENSRSFGLSGWWLVGMWSCGFLRATLMSFSSLGRGTHLLKLARFCITLAMSVSVRDVRSAGYSCIRLNREGDMMAGHMKRRNREELMRLSARSSLPRSAHRALQEAKTSFSSRGKMLKEEDCFTSPVVKFEVLFHGLRSERVLTKDQVLTVHEPIHLAHRHVRQELLRRRMCTRANATSSLLLTLNSGSRTAHSVL